MTAVLASLRLVVSTTRSMHCVAGPRLPLAMASRMSLILVASAAVVLFLAPAAAERNLLQFPGEDCAVGTKPTVIPESQRCGGDRNGCCQVPGHLLMTPDARISSHLILHLTTAMLIAEEHPVACLDAPVSS
jgi:hypothetical protein